MLSFRRATLFVLAAAAVAAVSVSPRAGQAQADREDVKIAAPDLPENQKWLNSKPLTMQGLRGKVVLVDFWEYTCVNCIRTFPYLKSWHQKYKDKGLVILGVHTPEFAFAKVEGNVTEAIKRFGLDYPHISDANYDVWRAYGNRYWPAKYLIDAQGFVRYFQFGEGSYGNTEAKIQQLLKEANPKVELPALTEPVRGADKPGAVCYPVTPEVYLGYERGGHNGTLGNREGYHPENVVNFKDPGQREDGIVYMFGPWKNAREALISTRANNGKRDYLALKYHAIEVNTVLKSETGEAITILVEQDGRPVSKADKGDDIQYDELGRSYILLDKPKMYSLLKNNKFGQHILKLYPQDPGMGIYSFTFVSCEVPKRK